MTTIESGAVTVDFGLVQGDGWPDEPIEFAVTEADETTPVTGLITSARLQVRASYRATDTLAALDSEDPGGPLTVSADGSTVTLAAGAVPGSVTTDWPVTDTAVPVRQQVPCRWDLEVTLTATGEPDTLVRGAVTVLPQVTR